MLAFCRKNPQEGCGSSGNPAELFSLNSPFRKGAFGVWWILGPSHLGVQVGVFWMQRVIAAAPSYKPQVWHKTLSLCFSYFPMLLVTQKGSYGEAISAGLTKSSHNRTEEKRIFSEVGESRLEYNQTCTWLHADMSLCQLLTAHITAAGTTYWPNRYFTLSCLEYRLVSLSSLERLWREINLYSCP